MHRTISDNIKALSDQTEYPATPQTTVSGNLQVKGFPLFSAVYGNKGCLREDSPIENHVILYQPLRIVENPSKQ